MNARPRNGRFDDMPPLPRKIRLDSDVYCPHSVRARDGDANCDHDFERAPSLAEPAFAEWKCTKCEREFRFEIWRAGRRLS